MWADVLERQFCLPIIWRLVRIPVVLSSSDEEFEWATGEAILLHRITPDRIVPQTLSWYTLSGVTFWGQYEYPMRILTCSCALVLLHTMDLRDIVVKLLHYASCMNHISGQIGRQTFGTLCAIFSIVSRQLETRFFSAH